MKDLTSSYGSKGISEHKRAGLPYWDVNHHSPVAVYHTLHLGVCKDMLGYMATRVGLGESPKGILVLYFHYPRGLRTTVLEHSTLQVVLRNKPDCIVPDWLNQKGKMTMHDTMLTYEVPVPYLCHDMPKCGVPDAVPVMWLLLRFAAIIFTRVPPGCTQEEE